MVLLKLALVALLLVGLTADAPAQFNQGQSIGSTGFGNVSGSAPASSVMITEASDKMLTEDGNHMVVE